MPISEGVAVGMGVSAGLTAAHMARQAVRENRMERAHAAQDRLDQGTSTNRRADTMAVHREIRKMTPAMLRTFHQQRAERTQGLERGR